MSSAYTPVEGRTGVLVVDLTRSLADPSVDGAHEVGVAAAEETRRVVEAARATERPVFFTHGGLTYYTSEATDVTTVERGGWPRHAPRRDEPAERSALALEILPSLAPDEGVVIRKTGPSAFFDTPLATYLGALGVRTLVVCGMMTSGCVRATVVDAFSRQYDVVLPRETVADRRPELHRLHLEDLDGRYARVVPTDTVVEQLLEPS